MNSILRSANALGSRDLTDDTVWRLRKCSTEFITGEQTLWEVRNLAGKKAQLTTGDKLAFT